MKLCNSEIEFILTVAPSAQRAGKRYNMLPSILIAQSALELGFAIKDYWDNPSIADLLKYNNMVGQKKSLLSDSWYDKTVWSGKWFTKETPEEYGGKLVTIKDDFRIFDDIEQSYCDYILFLLYASNEGYGGKPKYGKEVVEIKDPQKLITEIRKRGYATSHSYDEAVMRIVKRHNLTAFDDVSNVEPSMYVPNSLKTEYGLSSKITPTTNIKKLVPPKFIDNRAASRSQVPAWRDKSDKKYIVVHYLGVVGQNFELWDNGYGATFTIAWNGDVYYTADYTAVTWQCGGSLQGSGGHTFYKKCTNYNSVSIETCVKRTDNKYEGDGDDDKWYFTEESQESLVWAVSKMMDDLNIPIERVIRHFDVTGKICPNPYVRNNGLNGNWTWNEFKNNLAQYRQDGTITIPNRSTPTPSPSKGYLSKGDTGEDVKTLQMMLNTCGFNCGNADGIFGNKTESALSAFRQAHKMTATPKYTDKVKAVLESAYKKATGAKYSTVYDGVDYLPVYNYTYYKKKYPTVAKALGTDKQKYFDNFIEYGMKAGRQGSAAFNVQNYKKRYEDLRNAFGDNLPEYYKHYCVYGKKEKRNAK